MKQNLDQRTSLPVRIVARYSAPQQPADTPLEAGLDFPDVIRRAHQSLDQLPVLADEEAHRRRVHTVEATDLQVSSLALVFDGANMYHALTIRANRPDGRL